MPGMKLIEPIGSSKSSGNPICHKRAKIYARNTKVNKGKEIHPVRVNAWYKMNWANHFFSSKSSRNPIFGQIFGHQRAKIDDRITKINRGQETRPIRLNARYEINRAVSLFKKFWKPCLQTNGQTYRQKSGWIQYTLFHFWWSGVW